MSKRNISLISTLFGLCIFLILAYGSSEDVNNSAESKNINNNYSIDTVKHISNKKKKLTIKKEIASIEGQRHLVKSFTKKIKIIEEPGTQSLESFLKILNYYQQGHVSPSDVIQSTKNTKRQCNNVLFALSDLKVPSNLPNEIEKLLNGAKNDLIMSWSLKGSTLNNIIDYFKDGNPKRIHYFNIDVEDAQNYTISAYLKISKAYDKLGIITELGNQKTYKSEKNSVKKINVKVNKVSNVQKNIEGNSEAKNIKNNVKQQNISDSKTKRQKRIEKRKRRRAEKKKRRNK